MLIVIKEDGAAYIAQSVADKIANVEKTDLILDENIPFKKVKGSSRCYVAFEHLYFSSEILMNNLQLFKGVETVDDVLSKVIPTMKNLLAKYSLIDEDGRWNNNLVIACNDKIFSVDTFFQAYEVNGLFVRCECADFITGGLEWENKLPVKERIKKIIRSYNDQCREVLFPIVMHDCKTGRKTILQD